MPRTSDKRERLVDAARTLIHQQGLYKTTLSDIAEHSRVPLGNVYYYFKTKEDLAGAVIDEHQSYVRAMLSGCEGSSDPKERLTALLNRIQEGCDEIAKSGCPFGSLCQELDKDRDGLADRADRTMSIMLNWITAQMSKLGRDDAEELGFALFARLQGTCIVGHSLHDAAVVERQLELMKDWLEAL